MNKHDVLDDFQTIYEFAKFNGFNYSEEHGVEQTIRNYMEKFSASYSDASLYRKATIMEAIEDFFTAKWGARK